METALLPVWAATLTSTFASALVVVRMVTPCYNLNLGNVDDVKNVFDDCSAVTIDDILVHVHNDCGGMRNDGGMLVRVR